jgi:hypothetical protein
LGFFHKWHHFSSRKGNKTMRIYNAHRSKMSTFMVKIPEGFLPQMASFFITQGQQDRAHFKCALV